METTACLGDSKTFAMRSKEILYAFDLTEVITGLASPVLYKLDRKKRFIIEGDVASILRQLQSSSFSISRLKNQLLELLSGDGPDANVSNIKKRADSFIAFLLKENLIVPVGNARNVNKEVLSLEARALNLRKLDIIGIELTNYCNFRCPHCSPDSGRKDRNIFLSLKVVSDIIDWARSSNIQDLLFTGGEPFAHPDICKIIEKLSNYPIQSVITTNGSLLKSKHMEAIRDSTIHVRVSLYGGASYYEAFGPDAETNARVREVILKLKSVIGKRFSCVLPVMGSNLKSYRERISFCEGNGIFYQVSVVSPFGRALSNWGSEELDRGLARRIKNKYDKYARKWNSSYRRIQDEGDSKVHIFPCSLNQLNILADGSITPCLSIRNMTIGKYREDRNPKQLFSLFYSQEYTDLQRGFSVSRRRVCSICEFKYDCGGGCPAKANACYGTVNAPDPQCENHNIPEVLKKLQVRGHEVKPFKIVKGGDTCETEATCEACHKTRP